VRISQLITVCSMVRVCFMETLTFDLLVLALFRHRAHSNPRLLSGEKRTLIFVLLAHPHFVRVSALRATTGLSTETFFVEIIISQPTTTCAIMAEDITLLLSKMIRAYYGFRYHRIRRATIVVGTGSAVSPYYLLLVCAKLMTRPIRRSRHPMTV
jgi:uncharacterized membrane protein